MGDAFIGTWKMVSSDNFDEYMKSVGVNVLVAKIGGSLKPTMIISREGDTWTLKSESTFKNHKVDFKIGAEFDETTIDDRKMKTTFTLDGNKLTQDQKGDIPSVITREVDGDKITVTCKAKDVVATRVYERA